MADSIKTAFDTIKAEDNLKDDTLSFLCTRIQKKHKLRKLVLPMRFAALIIALFTVGISYNLYFTENAYVDLDVNPSIELSVNRFGRVIGTYAYNSDGTDVLEAVSILHRNYRDAVGAIIDAMLQKGFAHDAGLVSVTLQTDDKKREYEMLANIKTAVLDHHVTALVDAFTVNGETRSAAHDANISPAKYLAILELQQVDSSANIENCRNHTIGELKRLTREHARNHHGGNHGGRHD